MFADEPNAVGGAGSKEGGGECVCVGGVQVRHDSAEQKVPCRVRPT